MCTPQSLFCIWPICNEIVFPRITYSEFVARKQQCDHQWVAEKKEFLELLWSMWYSSKEAYIVYQEISWYTHDRSSPTIYTLAPNFFSMLQTTADRYTLDAKEAIDNWTKNKKWPQKVDDPAPYPPERASKNLYRTAPQIEKTRYWNVSIAVKRYDRKTAAKMLTWWWYSFWSTNLQDEETGQSYATWSTSVEGVTQDLLDGLQTLMKLIESKKWSPAHLVLNGGSEWYDHWMGDDIMAGSFNPAITLLAKHAKAHGAGYTFDIRLSNEDALYLKTLFPGKSGKKQYGDTVFLYDYHGVWSSLHLHGHAFDTNTYEILFPK